MVAIAEVEGPEPETKFDIDSRRLDILSMTTSMLPTNSSLTLLIVAVFPFVYEKDGGASTIYNTCAIAVTIVGDNIR